jgi:hypothetical protein
MLKFVTLLLTVFFMASCVSSRTSGERTPTAENKKTSANTSAKAKSEERTVEKPTAPTETKRTGLLPPKSECLNIEAGDKAVLAKQTFPIDFEPFRTSCFVTLYNPENDDPPLESEIAIYTDGKEVFSFPNQFNGVEFGCWVEGVSFQDLNEDGLTDIIVAGMCSAKTAPYSENMVYVNTGTGFTTDINANYKLENFKKISEIASFVKKNQALFFK